MFSMIVIDNYECPCRWTLVSGVHMYTSPSCCVEYTCTRRQVYAHEQVQWYSVSLRTVRRVSEYSTCESVGCIWRMVGRAGREGHRKRSGASSAHTHNGVEAGGDVAVEPLRRGVRGFSQAVGGRRDEYDEGPDEHGLREMEVEAGAGSGCARASARAPAKRRTSGRWRRWHATRRTRRARAEGCGASNCPAMRRRGGTARCVGAGRSRKAASAVSSRGSAPRPGCTQRRRVARAATGRPFPTPWGAPPAAQTSARAPTTRPERFCSARGGAGQGGCVSLQR